MPALPNREKEKEITPFLSQNVPFFCCLSVRVLQALSLMEDRVRLGGHLPTLLRGLDDAMRGGIPFGALTELVGPSGIGKTQVKEPC